MGKANLLDSAQSLKVGMLDQIENPGTWNRYETVYGIIKHLLFIDFDHIS